MPLLRTKPYFELLRPINLLIGGFAVVVGFLLLKTGFDLKLLSLGILSVVLVMGGGNGLNDYYDIEIDRINQPKRPIPSGKITPGGALTFSIILLLAGVIISAFISLKPFLFTLLVIIALFIYNRYLKKSFLIGNILVSLLGGAVFIYIALVFDSPLKMALYPFLFAFLFHLGREVIKDTLDIKGDRDSGSRTFPVVFGEKAGIALSVVIFFLLIIVTFLPYLLKIYGIIYFISVIILVDIFLLILIHSLLFKKERLEKIKDILKIDMVLGLICLALGSL